jgi:regulation of enolase protein 1 (concanavalin A-like superfamily)
LGQLEITVSQDILSESTRELLIAAVDVWTTGAYGFVRGNERALYAAIRSDLTQHVLTRVSDKVHPRDALSKIGI